jgi:xylose isomerase domain-containing protein TIM barrel
MKVRLLFIMVCSLVLFHSVFGKQKPDSKFNGVKIGAITYSFRSMPDQSLDAILNYTVASGINSVELMGKAVEEYLGIPVTKDSESIKEWRLSVTAKRFKEIKKKFSDKGVDIHILKLGNPKWSDEEIDYAFRACKALGAKGISMEISEAAAKRMAPFADKHKLYVIFHNHLQPGNPDFSFEKILSYGSYLRLNFDAGHYYGATGEHPNELIERLHDRIVSIHIKDKTGKNDPDPNKNQQFGRGTTPIVDMLQLIQKNKWPINCDIELEYQIPEGSDAVKEVSRCVNYCHTCLQNEKYVQ